MATHKAPPPPKKKGKEIKKEKRGAMDSVFFSMPVTKHMV